MVFHRSINSKTDDEIAKMFEHNFSRKILFCWKIMSQNFKERFIDLGDSCKYNKEKKNTVYNKDHVSVSFIIYFTSILFSCVF